MFEFSVEKIQLQMMKLTVDGSNVILNFGHT